MKSAFLSIQSEDRATGSPQSFRWVLPCPLKNPRRISLLSVELPWVVFPVRSGTNSFSFSRGGTVYTATMAESNYAQVSDVVTALANSLNGLTGQSGVTWSLTVSANSMRISLVASQAVTIQPTTLSRMLGFLSESGTSVTASNPYRLGYDTFVHIGLSNVPSNMVSSRAGATFRVQIPVDAGYIQYNTEMTSYKQFCDVQQPSLGFLDITVRDFQGQLAPLGVEWSLLLRCDYDPSE
jgi:hypothetical protein